MKKNYIYLLVLVVSTVALTLLLSKIYKRDSIQFSYAYENLNKIVATEFDEYMIEHSDTIIYIADKTNLTNNKFEKKLVNKLKKINLLETIIYIEKDEINSSLEKVLQQEYSYEYDAQNLPVIIVINDGEVIQISIIDKKTDAETIIDYGVFE